MKDIDHKYIELSLKQAFDARSGSMPTIDIARYMKHLDGMDLEDAQKHKLLEALLPIMVCFADIAFGMHPVQQACGQLEEPLANSPGTDSDGGRLSASTTHNDMS